MRNRFMLLGGAVILIMGMFHSTVYAQFLWRPPTPTTTYAHDFGASYRDYLPSYDDVEYLPLIVRFGWQIGYNGANWIILIRNSLPVSYATVYCDGPLVLPYRKYYRHHHRHYYSHYKYGYRDDYDYQTYNHRYGFKYDDEENRGNNDKHQYNDVYHLNTVNYPKSQRSKSVQRSYRQSLHKQATSVRPQWYGERSREYRHPQRLNNAPRHKKMRKSHSSKHRKFSSDRHHNTDVQKNAKQHSRYKVIGRKQVDGDSSRKDRMQQHQRKTLHRKQQYQRQAQKHGQQRSKSLSHLMHNKSEKH